MATDIASAAGDKSTLKSGQFCRMTPLEYDIMLQQSEHVFRSLLEGRPVHACTPNDIDEWYAKELGAEWVKRNQLQREEIKRRVLQTGENTPMWLEAHGHMSDIAWEVFETGKEGERLRKFSDVSRDAIIDEFKNLLPKMRESSYAKYGAAHENYGLRACIAVLRVFVLDAEVLQLCAECLQLLVDDPQYEVADRLSMLSMPMSPAERHLNDKEVGWSFLRAAFEAFLVHAGGELCASSASAFTAKQVELKRSPETAVELAKLVVAASKSMQASGILTSQFECLQQTESACTCPEQREVLEMLHVVRGKAVALQSDRASSEPELATFIKLLGGN